MCSGGHAKAEAVDPGAKVGGQRPFGFGGQALGQFGAVLHPKDHGVDAVHVQGVAMGEKGRVDAKLGA